MSDGTCKAEPKEPQRAIPHELECLANNVDGMENAAGQLLERLQSGLMPEADEEREPAPERTTCACSVAEAIAKLSDRVRFVKNRINDLCQRVQL